nr:PREDICTED: CD99 antigen-like protein 2 [Anolis carolinensis]|eukprot:XP_008116154.1 PREDICTED: CD99 antigen-like protein 2 [Anolis carolinensis]
MSDMWVWSAPKTESLSAYGSPLHIESDSQVFGYAVGHQWDSLPGYADDFDFNLEDALDDDVLSTKRRKSARSARVRIEVGDFDLPDPFDTPPERTTKPAKATTGPYPRKPEDGRWNVLHTTTTKQPKTTKPPPKKTPAKDPMDFDLSDALDDQNDGRDGGMPNVNPGGRELSDSDLADILDEGGYKPDKKKGGSGVSGGGESNYDDGALVETGTIAGIVSGLGHGPDWRREQLHLLPAKEVLLQHTAGPERRVRERREHGSCCD